MAGHASSMLHEAAAAEAAVHGLYLKHRTSVK